MLDAETGAVDADRYWRDGFLKPVRVADAGQAADCRAR